MLEQPENPVLPQCENAQVRSISREVDLAWLAGIIDGEGAISCDLQMIDTGRSYLDGKVRVYNTDVRMIQKIARIYTEMNVVFFYNLNKKVREHYKNQLGICVTSQGSCRKVLEAVLPYLANKQEMAKLMIEVIRFVQSTPKDFNKASDYYKHPTMLKLIEQWNAAKVFHIDPSTTKRKAREVLSW